MIGSIGWAKTSMNTLDKKNTGGGRYINKFATNKPSATATAAAANKPTAEEVAKQKKTRKSFHFCSRGYL